VLKTRNLHGLARNSSRPAIIVTTALMPPKSSAAVSRSPNFFRKRMQLRFRSILLVLAASFVVAACSLSSGAQQAGTGAYATTPAAVAPAAIPDAPAPQIELAAAVDPQSGQAQNTQQPATRYGS